MAEERAALAASATARVRYYLHKESELKTSLLLWSKTYVWYKEKVNMLALESQCILVVIGVLILRMMPNRKRKIKNLLQVYFNEQ